MSAFTGAKALTVVVVVEVLKAVPFDPDPHGAGVYGDRQQRMRLNVRQAKQDHR